ncbi:MAG: CopD family protein [Planctomycetota bacterium]|jgi:putative copper export protein
MQILIVILHVLGATVWTGGHLVLAIGFLPAALRERDPEIIRGFESRFERIGIPALGLQVITGILLALPYLPDADAGETLSGHVAGVLVTKFVLLVATIGLAVHARLRLVPKLTPETLRPLAMHIIAVTVIAVLFVVVGASLRMVSAAGA